MRDVRLHGVGRTPGSGAGGKALSSFAIDDYDSSDPRVGSRAWRYVGGTDPPIWFFVYAACFVAGEVRSSLEGGR